MQSTPMSTPNLWKWDGGDWDTSVQYTPGEADSSGMLTWVEDLDPFKDERGNGSHIESPQPLDEFLSGGPRISAPVETVEAILAHLGVKKPVWLDSYRLQKAVVSGKLAAVQEMLARGVEADMPVRGTTAFYCAVSSRQLAIAEDLFAAGVDVNRSYRGMDETVLMTLATYAPDASWEPLAKRIIAQGAELEARNCYGETPLMTFARAGRRLRGMVRALLDAGAEVNARSQHGYTALWWSVTYPNAPVEVVKQLIEAEADVNACDKEGVSVIMEAISCSLVECVRCLLAAGADVQSVSAPTQQYQSPKSVLQYALDYANPEIIQLIQQAGAK